MSLVPIRGGARARALSRMRRVTTAEDHGAARFRSDWLDAGRVVVLEESGFHLDADQQARIAETAERVCACRSLVAVATEKVGAGDDAFQLDAREADLAAFSEECTGYNYLLLPADSDDAAVLCTTDDFVAMAGQRLVVESLTGGTANATARFEAFVSGHFEVAQRTLRRELDYYSRWRVVA